MGLDFARSGALTENRERFLGGHPAEELHDLESDPCELRNLAEDPGRQKLERDMQRRLVRWVHDTDDPLLSGPVPSPYHRREVEKLQALAWAKKQLFPSQRT